MVLGDKLGCKYLGRGFPRVVRFRVPLPFDKVLQLLRSPEVAVVPDLFHFEFHFSFYHVRRGPRVVDPVFCRLAIRSQQGGVTVRLLPGSEPGVDADTPKARPYVQ